MSQLLVAIVVPFLVSAGPASKPAVADSVERDRTALHGIADQALRVWRDSSSTNDWGSSNPAQRRRVAAREDQWARRLAAMRSDEFLGTPDWRLYATLRTAIDATRAQRVCHAEWWNVDQLFGWQALTAFQSATAPLSTAEHRGQLVASFRQLPAVADVQIADLRAGARAGYTAPIAMVTRVVAQIDALIADTSASSDLMTAAGRDTSPAFVRTWKRTVNDYARPALRRYRDFLAGDYSRTARHELGLASLPNGRACYRAQLYANSGVDTDPDSLYAVAIRGLALVHATMQPLAVRLLGGSDVIAAERALRSDPRFLLSDPDSALAAYRAMVGRAAAPLPQWFARVPTESLEVVAVPRSQASTFPPAKYVQSPGDGTAPAQLMANVYQPGGVARMNIALGVVHEGLPGHHFQYIYARSGSNAHPVMRLIGDWSLSNGYREGWAIYSEALAAEMGVYTSAIDSIGYLTHLDDVYTALRTDIGIHYYGWTREQAIDSMMIAAGRPRAQAESYADRHAASPGQLASYGIGYVELVAIREEAERALGQRFDIRQFHDQILNDGPVPLPTLRTKMRRWIESRR